MSGFITVKDKDGNYRVYETPGETWVEIASAGYPDKLAFGDLSIVSAEWTDGEDAPEPQGKTIEEAAADAEAKAQKEAQKTAEPEPATSKSK
jgi:hypothetical protein